MKRPFEVGDKIAVYTPWARIPATIERLGLDGTIVIENDVCYHPKQCRRLINKKSTRRRIWIHKRDLLLLEFSPVKGNENDFLEFLEVKKKK